MRFETLKLNAMRIVLLLVLCLSPLAAVADEADSEALSRIAFSIAIDFEPVGAWCAFRVGGDVSLTRALFLPEEQKADEQAKMIQNDNAAMLHNWIVGCPVPNGVNTRDDVSIVIDRKGGRAVVRSVVGEEYFAAEKLLAGEDQARKYLTKRREILTSFTVQIKAQERELSVLRNDADTIGSKGTIRELERKVEEGDRTLAETNRDLQNLQDSIKAIRASVSPPNSASAEVEITKQLTELAQAARGVEATERERSMAGEGQLSEKMRIIEETRYDDIEKIRADLVKMRRRRQELEDSLRGENPSPLDYE